MDKRTLSELLECSVCMEPFNECNNKVLPCQHTFCRFCLDAIVAVENRLICPECRLPVDTRVDDLPSNVLLNRILSTLKNTSSNDNKKHRERRLKKGLSSIVDYGVCSTKDVSLPCAKALYSYKALENGDLSFKKDDVIELLYQVDKNWFVGRLNGKQGFMPSNYIQILFPLPSQVPACRAKHDFTVADEGWKKDCLTFKKSDNVSVIRRVNKDWLEGSFDHKVGIFPATFVELNDAAKLLLLRNRSACDVDAWIMTDGTMNDKKPTIAMKSTSDNLMTTSSFDGISSSIESHAATKSNPNLSDPLTSPTSGFSESLDPPSEASEETKERNPICPNFGGDGILPLFQALSDHLPEKCDELELEIGKMYVALKDKGDGWLLGKSVAKGTVGLIPNNCVKFFKNWNYLEKGSEVCSMESTLSANDVEVPNGKQREVQQTRQSNSFDSLCGLDHLKKFNPRQKTNPDKRNRRSVNVEFLLTNSSLSPGKKEEFRCRRESSESRCHGDPADLYDGRHRRATENDALQPLNPSRGRLRLSSIAYGVSSLIHRNMVKQKMLNKRCMSATTSRSN